jgi:DNA-binding NarL/FixJ family response regulator
VHGDYTTLLADHSLKFIVVDLGTGRETQSIELIRRIHLARPDLYQIVLGDEDDEVVIEAILAGARAYLDLNAGPLTVSKAFEEVEEGTIWARRIVLSKVIDRLMKNGSSVLRTAHKAVARLTSREHQVVELILQARSNREIAAQLGIEERTVKAHLGHLMRKVGVSNRIELSIWALKHGNTDGL